LKSHTYSLWHTPLGRLFWTLYGFSRRTFEHDSWFEYLFFLGFYLQPCPNPFRIFLGLKNKSSHLHSMNTSCSLFVHRPTIGFSLLLSGCPTDAGSYISSQSDIRMYLQCTFVVASSRWQSGCERTYFSSRFHQHIYLLKDVIVQV